MELKKLQKFGAYSIIAGAVLFTIYAVCFTFLLPMGELSKDFSRAVMNPNWIWICSVAFIGIILTIFGFTAIYSRIHSSSGWIGFSGYFLITLAYILQAAMLTWEIFIYPMMVSHEPSIALLRDDIMIKHPLITFFNIMFLVTIFLGVVLFGIALIRSAEFKKIGGILFLAGAILYATGQIYTAIAGVLLFAAGCIVLGVNLIRQN